MSTVIVPEIGDYYVTHESGTEGWVMEIVPNKTGTFRMRLRTVELKSKWTTYVPAEIWDSVQGVNA
jgi:hypothetical protein